MNLIARHLSGSAHIESLAVPVQSVCAFSGKKISAGIPLASVISDVFTDYAAIRHPSGWVSVEVARCIMPVVPNQKEGYNSLRNYSFYADASDFRLLRREEILDCLLPAAPLPVPFTVAVTFSNKKHLAYKCGEQWSWSEFAVITDQLGEVIFRRAQVLTFLPILQAWYTVLPGKADSAQQPTWFTKENMLTGQADYKRQSAYGIERFEVENERLKPFRDTALFKLIVHLLNKKVYAQD